VVPCYWFLCSAHLMRALAAQGRAREAAATAKEGLAGLGGRQGTGFSEMTFRAAAVEALDAAAEREEALCVVRDSLRELEARASRIPDPAMRHRFLNEVADNRRVLELAREWGAAE